MKKYKLSNDHDHHFETELARIKREGVACEVGEKTFELRSDIGTVIINPNTCSTCKWVEREITHSCTCEETPAINVFGYEGTFGCNFWRLK